MYHYLDRAVTSLDPGGRFTVWAMRGWVVAMHRRQCPCKALAVGFQHWHAAAALPHFAMAMTILNCESLEKRTFRAPGHPRVSEDEALLLDLLGKSGTARARDIRATLAMIVNEPAVPSLAIALESAALALADRGLRPVDPPPPAGIVP